jgi:ubiquinone/menaquinone biosynthesis C-methylase UbiE
LSTKKNKKEIQESYENLGGRIYDLRYETEQEEKYANIMKQILIHPGDIIFDNGCGTGLLLQRFENFCIGLDFSGKLISRAKRRLKNRSKINLVMGDAEYLPFKHAVFSKIFSITMLQNLPCPLKALLEIKRVVRSDSEVFLTTSKKAYSFETFKRVLSSSNLKIKKILKSCESKDWFAFL